MVMLDRAGIAPQLPLGRGLMTHDTGKKTGFLVWGY
jgi:hypothetical protein